MKNIFIISLFILAAQVAFAANPHETPTVDLLGDNSSPPVMKKEKEDNRNVKAEKKWIISDIPAKLWDSPPRPNVTIHIVKVPMNNGNDDPFLVMHVPAKHQAIVVIKPSDIIYEDLLGEKYNLLEPDSEVRLAQVKNGRTYPFNPVGNRGFYENEDIVLTIIGGRIKKLHGHISVMVRLIDRSKDK